MAKNRALLLLIVSVVTQSFCFYRYPSPAVKRTTVAARPSPDANISETSRDTGISEPSRRPTDLTFFGDYLFWRPVVSNFPYAVVAQETPVPNAEGLFNVQESIRNVNFDFKQGFRIGGAYQFQTGWQVSGEWTRLWAQGCAVNNAELPSFILPFLGDVLPPICTQVSAHQRVKFDQLNLDLVKQLYMGKQFQFTAFFGPVVTRIKQEQALHFFGTVDFGGGPAPTIVDRAMKNDFTGGGLRVGCALEYQPITRFSIFGKGSYGILAGKFKLDKADASVAIFPDAPTPLTQDVAVAECLRDVVNVFNIIAGIKCTALLHGERTLEAHLGYEFMLFPDQVRMPRTLTQLGGRAVPTSGQFALFDANGNVSFNGVTIGLVLNL